MHVDLNIKLNYEGEMGMPNSSSTNSMFHSIDNGIFCKVALPVLLITR